MSPIGLDPDRSKMAQTSISRTDGAEGFGTYGSVCNVSIIPNQVAAHCDRAGMLRV